MMPIEGENALMLQLRETAGRATEFAVSSPIVNITGVTVCDVTGAPLSGKASSSLHFNPLKTKFIKLTW